MTRKDWLFLVALVSVLALAWYARSPGTGRLHAQDAPAQAATPPRQAPKAQPRSSNTRVKVDPSKVIVDDGDTVTIRWGDGDQEIVRILGIDTPETKHVEHKIPEDQPFGPEARAYAMGAFAVPSEIELLRCTTLDPYGRTLGYLFLNGKNYSLLVVRDHLAEESVSRYGDNGFPEIAAEVLAAARLAGTPPFESPGKFRNRMRARVDAAKEPAQGK